LRTALAGQASTPEFAFNEVLADTISQSHPRARPIRPASLDKMDMDKSLAFYRERFADASGFTFVFAGSFTIAEIQPLVERYLATLPAAKTAETWKDNGIRPPRGVIEKAVQKGIEPKSRTIFVFSGPIDKDRTKALALSAMSEILQTRLRNAIREDLGGTYNISVGAGATRVPVSQYTISIDFTGDPARMNALATRVLDEVAKFKQSGPTPNEMRDVKAAMARDFESNSRQNAYIAGQLAQRCQTGEPLESVWELPNLFNALLSSQVHDAARQYLDTGNYIRATLKPEK
jgi:zinc protease